MTQTDFEKCGNCIGINAQRCEIFRTSIAETITSVAEVASNAGLDATEIAIGAIDRLIDSAAGHINKICLYNNEEIAQQMRKA